MELNQIAGKTMKIKTWTPDMTDKETADLAYWERNCLALYYADGWYNDDVPNPDMPNDIHEGTAYVAHYLPRFAGWRRVLTLARGAITFHIPDDFDVGELEEARPNWDGHTTEEKWRRVLDSRRVPVDGGMG